MTTFDVLARFGTAALLRHVGTLVLFLLLHLLRIPFVLIERVLAEVMKRLDRYAVEQASRPPSRPINQFFPHDHTSPQEASHG
ncbi:hypothetical protein ACFWY9_16545 [Amycolatopsis sp. NPDC059027]|uniref:hypothetical protein n=1 Tax=Amycolatopsis sp. NPDC059027 TaxID=3346709 RepID=UPI00366EBC47